VSTHSTITFDPPLPCSGIGVDGSTRCGKDATVGTITPAGGGQYLLQPFCRECVAAMQQNYRMVERWNAEDEERRGGGTESI